MVMVLLLAVIISTMIRTKEEIEIILIVKVTMISENTLQA